jgi:hypothetical protein
MGAALSGDMDGPTRRTFFARVFAAAGLALSYGLLAAYAVAYLFPPAARRRSQRLFIGRRADFATLLLVAWRETMKQRAEEEPPRSSPRPTRRASTVTANAPPPWSCSGRPRAMQGPDYTHWHGMYEVGKNFYFEFLPGVLEAAERHGRGPEWHAKIDALLARDEHVWKQGLSPEEQRLLREGYKARYGEGAEQGGGPGLHAVEEGHRPGDPGSGTGTNR